MTTLPSVRTAPGLLAGVALAALLAAPAPAAEPAIHWRADYNAARKEAQEKGLPLLVEVGTEECFYCKKQDATTFRDPEVVALVNARFVPVRVDANRDPVFAQALRVQIYPTTVLGAPDGKVLSFLQGYTPADQLQEALKRAAPPPTAPEPSSARPRDLLASAREAFQAKRYADVLDACGRLGDSPEAEALAAQVTGDPEKLAAAIEQRNERTAALYLTLAETWEKKGQPKEARECLEKASKLCPSGKPGEQARAKLAALPKVAEVISTVEK
jgi:thioredoxin-like negative regulator of GroEL